MLMKPIIAILLAMIVLSPIVASSTDLRGRVDGVNPATKVGGPSPGVAVALFAVLPDGSFSLVRQATTGPDGVYYFSGIPSGRYILQIGGVNYPVDVTAGPKQDIPTISR
ncbi:MAG: hypothetical protein ABI883_02730 [Chthoniobacterales bacterium]